MYTMAKAALIALKVHGGGELTAEERQEMPPEMLCVLATSELITLTRAERDRMSPELLATLVASGRTTLAADEFDRFPQPLRLIVEDAVRRRMG